MNKLKMRLWVAKQFAKTIISPKAHFPLRVLNNLETLDYILQNNSSVVRFGDGDTLIMTGKNQDYQETVPELAIKMRTVLNTPSSEKLVVCIPDVFEGLDRYKTTVKLWWERHLIDYSDFYSSLNSDNWYGSAFISRPYMDYNNSYKLKAGKVFDKLKQIWENRDVLIVEGSFSRSGVGNDLFDGAKSVQRIICPPKNAFDKYDEIKVCIENYAKNKLILLMLGPTAKILAYELAKEGYTAIDLGHIDSEYEWYKMGTKKKVKLANKHTAEWNMDDDVLQIADEEYEKQIICDLTK